MKLSLVPLLMLCASISFAAGCARMTCETIEEKCGGGDDMIEECMDEYEDGDADCKSALRDLADCVDENGCNEDDCGDEDEDAYDACN